MIGSLYSGLSGILNYQKQLEVIGNNISNVNTNGYKAGRILFSDTISKSLQTARFGSEGTGGTDPKQIGTGVKVKAIDNVFTQGNLQETGVTTDLAIDGRGFFVISDGKNRYFTRSGAFDTDELGYLTDSGTGFIVQGKLANKQGVIETGSEIQDIQVKFGDKIPAKSTTIVEFASNLDARGKSKVVLGTNAFTTFLTRSDTAFTTNKGSPAYSQTEINNLDQVTEELSDGDTINISGIDSDGSTVTATFTYGTANDGTTLGDLVTTINTAFANSTVAVDDKGNIKLIPPGNATQAAELTLEFVNNDSDNSKITIPGFRTTTIPANEDTEINSSNQVSLANKLVAGDTIDITGIDAEGNEISETFTYGDTVDDPTYNGRTFGDLLDKIDEAYPDSTVSMDSNGNIILYPPDNASQDISLELTAGAGNTGQITLPRFNFEGYEYDTSFLAYDAEGYEHTVTIVFKNLSRFENTGQENKWSWEISVSTPGASALEGTNTGTITFNGDGSLKNFEFTDENSESFRFDPGNGAGLVSVKLDVGELGGFNGITQFASESNVAARHQDGYTMGTLQDFDIDEQGIMVGIYTNGLSKTLGQLALADFNNASGLLKKADSYYQYTPNSGQAVLGVATQGGFGYIRSGTLELSNVDLASEFTNLVIAQRAFQANSNVITTTDSIFNDLLRLKRA